MQEPQKEPTPVPQKMPIKVKLSNLIKALGEGKNMWRARLEGSQGEHAEETLSNALRSFGVTEEGIGFFGAFLNAWRKELRDDEAFHTVDRYLVGAMGVFDLILFQMLVSVGHPDWASSLSMVAFIVSLPCTVGSLFVSFLKKEYKITVYGRGHGTVSLLSVISTFVSSTALIYHIWPVAGLLFFFIAIIVAILCSFYATLVFIGKHFETTKPVESADEQVAQVSAEIKPTGPKRAQDKEA